MHLRSVRAVTTARWLSLLALSAALGCDESTTDDAGSAGNGGTSGSSGRAGSSANAGSNAAGANGGVSASAGTAGNAAGLGGTTAGSAGNGASGNGAVSGAAGANGGAGASANGGTSGAAGNTSGTAGTPPSGAGGTDAGAGGEAGETAGAGGAPPSSGDYLLCEDFESTALGDVPDGWQRHGDESAVAEDAERGKALRLGAIPVWERRIYHDASVLGSAHWGRVYYRVELPVPDAFVHSTLVALSGDGPTRGRSEYRVVDTVKQAIDTRDVGSRHQFLWNVQPEDSGEFGRGTDYDWFFDGEWHCAEYHIDASNQSYAFYWDGEQQLAIENGAGNYSGTDIPDSFDTVRIGWINYQESPPGFTAWLDDVAFDDERIGCD